jgi:hypothetical protein
MKALHAGYISGALWHDIRQGNLPPTLDWMDVISSLSHFVIDTDVVNGDTLPPEWSVFENLLCRGLPTLPSYMLEKWLAEATGLIVVSEDGKQDYETLNVHFDAAVDQTMRVLMGRALCVCASNVDLQPSTGFAFPDFGSGDDNTKFDSDAERTFWNGPLTRLLGTGGMQLALRQRTLNSIVKHDFREQRVDIAIEIPGWCDGGALPRGLVLEVDGPQHKDESIRTNDAKRNEACLKNSWAVTYRRRLWDGVPASQDIEPGHAGIQKLQSHPYLAYMNKNATEPLTGTEAGRRARRLALAPFAVARIQRVLLELLKAGRISASAPEWNVVVIDRDGLPGVGQLAADDMREWLSHIHALFSPEAVLPAIHVVQMSDSCVAPGLDFQPDAVIDLSVEMRYGVRRQAHISLDALLSGGRTVVVRSDYYRRVVNHEMAFSEPLAPRVTGTHLEKVLTFFLRNIFRKCAFRPKQVEIISRALHGESVIALLPTGAGKSITYQLPTLLQNGMSAVVAPIKSLMKDQDDNLRAAGITCSAYINSMSTADEKRFNTELMVRGCLKFAFISPERLVIREFRNALERMKEEAHAHFAYVVVDEAHCVSEWGHDFRTSYLRLGANARRYCASKWPRLPLLALTGTASLEVLEDVKQELGFERGEEETVRPEKMARDNLMFNVVQIEMPSIASADAWNVGNTVGNAKLSALSATLQDLTTLTTGLDPDAFLQSPNSGSGLVFSPHAGLKGGLHGVLAARAALCTAVGADQALKIGVFYGSAEDAEGAGFNPITVQNSFKNGDIRILACTKAFGMGIDKPDIRFTLHTNIPPSLESFYQEAGRAGRDGEVAQCWILYSGALVDGNQHSFDFHLNHQFHMNSFPGADLEEAKVIEMLDQNRAPGHSTLLDLENHLGVHTGVEFRIRPWSSPDKSKRRIYINHPEHPDGKVFVYFANDGELACSTKTPFPNCQGICHEAIQWLNANKPMGLAWIDWLFQQAGTTVAAGIEDVLAQTVVGTTSRICVSFENGYVEEITKQTGISPADVRKAMGFIRDVDDFLHRLSKKKQLQPNVVAWVRSVFPKIRLREYTFRALYRLSILGVVTDFEVDYANKTMTADLVHLQPDACRKHLRDYLLKRAPMEAESYIEQADQSTHATELRRCLHGLITFVYERIAKQRIEALRIMEQTCVQGVQDPAAFREAVTYFFDSKYLLDLRPYLHRYTTRLVFDMIEETAARGANLNHLLGACNRLLPENPENAAFHALRGYAMALLGYVEKDVLAEFEAATEKFAAVLGWRMQEKLTFLNQLRHCFVKVPGATTTVIDAVILNEHVGWLKKFNTENRLSGNEPIH